MAAPCMTIIGNRKVRIGLVLSGSDPMLTLASGALLGFMDKGIEFDVISATGIGAVAALQALAPREKAPKEALEALPNLYMSDLGYNVLPFNVRMGMKNSPFAEPMYRLWKMFPRFEVAGGD